MSVFPSPEAATEVFGSLFAAARQDDRFTGGLREAGITMLFEHRDPGCRVFVSADELITGDGAPGYATLVVKSSCDDAHALWLGLTTFPALVTTGRMKILGKVSKVLEVMPALVPVFEHYPAVARDAGLTGEPARAAGSH
jgi:hypothetical protein